MSGAVFRLPPDQVAQAYAAYRAAIVAKRMRLALGLAVLAAALVMGGIAGEVDLAKFFGNIHALPNYIRNLVPSLTWANLPGDIAEWFWNFREWFHLLIDTLLIAYLGTLFGMLGGFSLCFFATANLGRSRVLRIACRRFLEFCRTVPEIVFALLFV